MGLRLLAQLQAAHRARAKLEETQPEGIAAGVGVAADQPVMIEDGEQPVDGALVQRQPFRDFAGGQLAGVLRQHLQAVNRALEHLHAIGRAYR